MVELSYQFVMKEKLSRQESIPKLEFHANGLCVHLGQISPGCRQCFSREPGGGVQLGTQCMCDCEYCYYDPDRQEEDFSSIIQKTTDHFHDSLLPNIIPISFSYQSAGETLKYLPELAQIAAIHAQIEDRSGNSIYHHLYTNGLLMDEAALELCQEMRVDEFRVHLSASKFSPKVYENMKLAKKMGFTVSVEEPSYPPNRDALFEMLPVIEEIGISHLNLVEVSLTNFNWKPIEKVYPEGKVWKDHFYHLYDEGLVYDIIEEVIVKNYSYSVIDCNSGVERSRHSGFQSIHNDLNTLDGMCAPFNFSGGGYRDYN